MYVRELTRRMYRKEVLITGPETVYALCRKMTRLTKEHFVAVLVNSRHAVIAIETISIGSLNASIVHPRELMLPAITLSAAAIICVHNHPSGSPEPSEEDVAITRRIAEAGILLGIPLLDHVIVARNGYVSLKERCLLK